MTAPVSTVLLTVAYDGTSFHGWAPQHNARTVAGELLGAIQALHPTVRSLRGASRTDAGVHARGQRAAFDDDGSITPKGWVLGLARHLPSTISVRHGARVPAGFVPRFAATGKRYVYTLLRDPLRDPFWEDRAWRHNFPLQLPSMREAAAHLLGTHDFRAFRGAQDERTDTVCTLRRLDILPDAQDPRRWEIVVEGDRFLYNMVRIVVGTLVDIGRQRLAPTAMEQALASGHRSHLGTTAPAGGLLLDEVFLPIVGDNPWPLPV
jgi:tRNA pseudouridine38-40 synthase